VYWSLNSKDSARLSKVQVTYIVYHTLSMIICSFVCYICVTYIYVTNIYATYIYVTYIYGTTAGVLVA